jgi:hypothetical protein
VERDQPQHPSAWRGSGTPSDDAVQTRSGRTAAVALYHVYHNFCLPHASLRLPLPQPEPTHGSGSAKQWRPCTPAMAAGLTDHIWTLREVLLFRVPAWPQPAGG